MVKDDGGTHPKNLLAKSESSKGVWDQMDSRDVLISPERTDPKNPVVVNIQTRPDVGARHIVIPAVPKKQLCVPSTETANKYGVAYSNHAVVTTSDLPKVSNDGHGHKYFKWDVDVETQFGADGKDGIVSSASCRKSGSQLLFYELEGQAVIAGSHATCSGWWQELGRQITMDVSWYKKGLTCTEIEWPDSAKVMEPAPKPKNKLPPSHP